MNPQQKMREDWGKFIRESGANDVYPVFEKCADYWLQAISEERERLEKEVGEMKGESGKRLNTYAEGYKNGWNQALDEVIKLL